MAYIGKTPSQATRSRFYFTATGGETSLSGADDNGNTLVFSDGNYVDVMLNGVTLVAGTDYNTTTANTIGGLTALTASDIVEIVVYDTFSVFGGDVKGDFNVQNGTLTAEAITGSGDMAIDTDTLFVDVSQDRVGVGTSSPRDLVNLVSPTGSRVVLENSTSSLSQNDELGAIEFYTNDSSNAGVGVAASIRSKVTGTTGGQAALIFSIANASTNDVEAARFNSSGNLVFPNGQGIDFGASQGAGETASVLDDYEEGTWSPTIHSYTGSYTTQQGEYVKVGGKVYASGRIVTTGGTGSFTSFLQIANLPFAASHTITSGNLGTWTQVLGTQSVPSTKVAGGPLGGPNSGLTRAFMNSFDTSGNSGNWSNTYSDASVNCEFRFHVTYFT